MSSRRGLIADVVPASCVDGPGNRFVVFVQGCNFDCLACHNPHTIAMRPHSGAAWTSVEELLDQIRGAEPFISGVTVSGGEATVQWRFVLELFEAMATDPALARLTRLVDSNGEASEAVWLTLSPALDGAMVDLKAIDPDVHVFLTGRDNERVLRSIELLAGLDKLHEVRLLVIPGVNDRPDDLAATARRLVVIAPDVAVRLNAFRRAGTRAVADPFPEATPDDLRRVADTLVANGVRRDAVRWSPVGAEGLEPPTSSL